MFSTQKIGVTVLSIATGVSLLTLLQGIARAQPEQVEQLCSVIDANRQDPNRELRGAYCRLAALAFGPAEIAQRGQNGVSAPQSQISNFNQNCQDASNQLTRNPASIRYPAAPNTIEIFPGVYVAYGQMDAENDYGVLRRSAYICAYVWNGSNTDVIGVQAINSN